MSKQPFSTAELEEVSKHLHHIRASAEKCGMAAASQMEKTSAALRRLGGSTAKRC